MEQEPLKEQKSEKTYEEELYDILSEIGIGFSESFILVLHNDNVNDMIHVVVALYEVCKLTNEQCVSVMMEAHNKGGSVITTDELDILLDMKSGLDGRGLTSSIEVLQKS
jgi:ATP-dependent Clp protease adaptor protein ClpS